MPRVPRVERQVTIAALPGVRKSAAATAESEGAGLALAEGRLAATQARGEAERFGAVAAFGATAATIAARTYAQVEAEQRQKADEVALLSSDRQLADWEADRLHDPEHGLLQTVKGKEALGLRQTIREAYDTRVGELEMALQPRQRRAFQRLAEARRLNILRATEHYTAEQYARYEAAETEAAVEMSTQLAIANASSDTTRIGAELDRVTGITRQYAQHRGLGAEATQAYITKARSDIHEGVIATLLAEGRDQEAGVYFEMFDQDIAGDRHARITRGLESGTTAGTGLRAADAIWRRLGPKGDEDPIQLDQMEDAARQRFSTDPKALDATIKYLRERKAAVDAGRKEREETIAGTLWAAASQGASLEQIRRLPGYVAAPGRVQAQITDYIVNRAEREAGRAYAEEGRAYTRAQRVEAEKTERGWARYWELSQPDVLTGLSDHALNALRGELGDHHVNELLEGKRKLAGSELKVREATIDQELFNTIAGSAGLHPYKPGLTEADKATLGQLRNTVEGAIDTEQRSRNRALTREEKSAVMQRIIDRRVMVDRWGSDVTLPAAIIQNPSDRENAYIPVDQIPGHALTQWVNVIRSTFPREQTMTREQIVARYRDRIQRAHAAAVLGLGADEELRRLQGR